MNRFFRLFVVLTTLTVAAPGAVFARDYLVIDAYEAAEEHLESVTSLDRGVTEQSLADDEHGIWLIIVGGVFFLWLCSPWISGLVDLHRHRRRKQLIAEGKIAKPTGVDAVREMIAFRRPKDDLPGKRGVIDFLLGFGGLIALGALGRVVVLGLKEAGLIESPENQALVMGLVCVSGLGLAIYIGNSRRRNY